MSDTPPGPGEVPGRAPAVVLEELAAAVMSADAADEEAVGRLLALLDELAATGHAVSAAAAVPAAPGAFVLPEWGDEKTLREFLAAQRGSLDELEEEALAMESGDPEKRAAFKRRLHTMKGEAGVLGLDDLERACHGTEDFLERRGVSAEVTDTLLKVLDWMAKAGEAYGRMRLPEPGAEELIVSLLATAKATSTATSTAEPSTLSVAAPEATRSRRAATPTPTSTSTGKVERDAETVSLFGEFLSESGEGLNRVDQILMNVERDGVDGDSVNSLFRVFHTIKGTAGFLELTEVVSLGHDTETMLNRCRENTLELAGGVIDLVFDATSALREMLDGVRLAVEAGTGFPSRAGLDELLARIQTVIEGHPGAERELPGAAQGEKLGEVLTHPPLSVPREVVEQALRGQAASGRRLGEELVATGAVGAAEVGAALRAQARVAPPEESGPAKLKETIKVDLERVDSLVEMIGELVVVESMVVNAPEISKASSVRVRNCLAQLAKVTRDLQDVGMRMRMVPVAGVFQKMARLVRDLSRKSG